MKNDFIQFSFKTADEELRQILIARLSATGFDGFEETSEELLAYVPQPKLNEQAVREIAEGCGIEVEKRSVPKQNWNALWESNFSQIIVNNRVGIRAAFHKPLENVQYEIIITPKMSFGTGHHATTYMMIEQMCRLDVAGKTVFDFGTGTGVLAILAEKLGAAFVMAIDNDEWSIENAKENISENNCNRIQLALTSKPSVEKKYNIVLANITLDVISKNFSGLEEIMQEDAYLVLSGFLADDEAVMLKLVHENNLTHCFTIRREQWISLLLQKQACARETG